MPSPEETKLLTDWLSNQAQSEGAHISRLETLSGGAIQENWALDIDFSSGPLSGRHDLVLRTDAPASVSASHTRTQEFSLLKLAFSKGVTTPEPLWNCEGEHILGRPFFVMRRIRGEARGYKLTRGIAPDGGERALLDRLGQELAAIHTIKPPLEELSFLPVPELKPAIRDVVQYREYLDTLDAPRPILEWGLSWLERHAPESGEIVLTHRDFRTGNYMVDDNGLTGILDWEFAAWGDPMSDIGWFCAKCWRFAARDREAGGIGERQDFYAAYERVSGRAVDQESVRYWEVMAHVRWAIIAIQQGNRFAIDGEENLEAALTAYVVPELEFEIMNMTGDDI